MNERRSKPDYWFPAKRYGIGWDPPICRQGWVFVVVWLLITLGGVIGWLLTDTNQVYRVYALIGFITMLVVLFTVIALKGEKPLRWRWGEDESASSAQQHDSTDRQ